ncbi:aspartate aminotransferase family protein [Burkholderia multivorans]|uniref:aspartate aminotransferase family protein n=1 Tax=Burkholderia multivorans TaxID=87883 RepID=UPI0007577454|nr:aspartate aminotransferase family protein [Burkholderia multivorans]AOJ94438.1 omega amino acid--pyruvate aminotransferase [Burkholderia multivorans]KVS09152.1 omega amino acid--pyruvate aminotransferase [Burkholderia multivorans]MBU9312822.1 aspartate aminotransferase family protein [Burkholderia multivorans]MBU9364739.1 aspartate aminotransferase family protein [Burkholderia multivorans]MDN8100007.1 aspartate aminotransferase family protein [Burkholderia multivorans]
MTESPSNTPDLSAFWMPFTANRQFKDAPRLLVSAKGMYYTSDDGRRILDGTAGLWCVNAGHCRDEIVAAIGAQAAEMDFAPTFQMGHPKAFEAATRIARHTPGNLKHVFFTNSGSEAVDTALKIALAYHRARGEAQRTRFVGRERGYHGVGFGGISVGGIAPNRRAYSGALLPAVDHLPHTLNIAEAAFSKGQPAWGAHLADELERIVALHDASTIAAVIVEPVAGSAGVLIPPQGYLERLRALCDRYGILLIFDEVITGWGRLGAPFAAQFFGVTPDLLTMAKGTTNAAVPMGAVAASATLDVYEHEQLFDRAARMAPVFEREIHKLRDARHVIDVRNLGLVGGVELKPRDGKPGTRAYDVFVRCYRKGAMIRYTGDILAFSPPLIVEEAQIAELFAIVAEALKETD